jgi:DnaJ-class molecular chaperone
MEFQDYYQTLGVKRDTSEKEIHSAFRKLARKHHPDVNPGDKAAEARFKAINEAHEVLGDPEKRKQYDRFGADWQRYQQAAGGAGQGAPADFDQWFTGRGGRARAEYRDADGAGGDFSDFFESIFGSRARGNGRARPRRGEDQEYDVEITLEEADRGATRLLELQLTDQCPVCQGSGVSNGRVCANCQGLGWVARTKRLEARIVRFTYSASPQITRRSLSRS